MLKKIELSIAVDVESKEWPCIITIPTIFEYRKVKHYNVKTSVTRDVALKIYDINPLDLMIYDTNKVPIDYAYNIIVDKWNDLECKRIIGQNSIFFE